MNTNELKKVMLDNGDTSRVLAEYLGMAESTFSCKLHERGAAFRKQEIQKIIDRYGLSSEQIITIFFNPKFP